MVTLDLITKKTKEVLTIFIVVLCATLFYSHQFVPELKDDLEYSAAKKKFEDLKKENTNALTEVKNSVKGTPVYDKYLAINKKKNKAYKECLKIYDSKKVYGFISLRHFLERFGFVLCIFIYALYNLIKSYLRERGNIGSKIFHTYILSICFFSFFWIFQRFQDFNDVVYYFMTITSACLVTYAVLLTTKYYKERINKTRQQMYEISKIALRNAKPEKQDEVYNRIKEIAND